MDNGDLGPAMALHEARDAHKEPLWRLQERVDGLERIVMRQQLAIEILERALEPK